MRLTRVWVVGLALGMMECSWGQAEEITHTTTHLSSATAYLSGASAGDLALFAGGNYFGQETDLVDVYDSTTRLWSTSTLSAARYGMTSTTVGGQALFAGGSSSHSDRVDIYDAGTDEWTTASLIVGRYDMCATSVGNKALFAGGYAYGSVVDIYDSVSGAWSMAALSVARQDAAATSVGHLALFAGGEIRGGGLSDIVDIYDADMEVWSVEKLSMRRTDIAAVTVGKYALFAGGYGPGATSAEPTDLVEIFNEETGEWTTARLSQARGGIAAAAVGDLAFFAGGNYGSKYGSDVVDIFDASTGLWSTTTLSVGRKSLAATSVGDTVLFAGGIANSNENSFQDVVDLFTVTPDMGAMAFHTVPEPMTLTLIGLGSVLLLGVRRYRVKKVGMLGVLLGLLLMGSWTWGEDITWDHDPATPGDWFDPLNWNLDRLPTSVDVTYVENGGVVTVNSDGAAAYDLNLGYNGIGVLEQTGGTVTTEKYLRLGYAVGTSGRYTLTDAALGVGSYMYVGYNGTGEFTQTGGTVNVTKELFLGDQEGSEGTYVLDGDGELPCLWLTVGGNGLGTLIQNSGTVRETTDYRGCRIGSGRTSEGTYELRGGNLIAGQINVGSGGTGTLIQSGSANAILSDLFIGGNGDSTSKGQGTYELSGSGYLSNPTTYVGYGSQGVFRQSGATNTVTTLNVGTFDSDSVGSYELSGGLLSVFEEHLGTLGVGNFTQSGGVHRVWSLDIGPNGTMEVSGGTLETHDRAVIEGDGQFKTGPWVLRNRCGLADYSKASVFDGSQASFSSEEGTLTIFPSGFDPATGFASCSAAGLTHIAGSTLVVPASQRLVFWGWVDDPVHINGGSITNANTSAIDLRGGFTLSNGGTFTNADESLYTTLTVLLDGGATGTIEASGGHLTAEKLTIGDSGIGSFVQHGGVVDVDDNIHFGVGSGSEGHYLMDGGTLNAGRYEYVGYYGAGHFIQTGGVHNVSLMLSLGEHGPGGLYELGGSGELHVGSLRVGYNSPGEFRQTGGTFYGATTVYRKGKYIQSGGQAFNSSLSINGSATGTGDPALYQHSGGTNTVTGNIYIGSSSSRLGTYEISGTAELYAENIYVGGSGTGTFINNGGTYNLTGDLILGKHGTYIQGTGNVAGDTLSLGSNGESFFTLNGGTAEFDDVQLGMNASGTGTLNINDTGELTAYNFIVGNGGAGYCNQNCGMLIVRNNLVIGATGSGQYIGGVSLLNSKYLVIGEYDTGLFQTAGGEIIADTVTLGSESGSLGNFTVTDTLVRVGNLYVGGNGTGAFNLNNSSADVAVSNALRFGAKSSLSAPSGSAIHMTGSAFENQSTNPDDLADLVNLTLVYDGHTGETDPFELAGSDLGRDLDGFVSNFALGGITLEHDSVLQMVDLFDNAHRDGVGGSGEALYLESLTMLPGSTLDLNGFHVYVRSLDYQGGTILNGQLISLLTGDADGNWKVDGADLALWQQNYDPLGDNPNTFGMGDFDNNGAIDGADLALWQQKYDPLGNAPAESVPEPGTLMLVGSGVLGLAGLTRRRLMH